MITLEDFLRKNAPLKNMFAGRRCFLVGNGPSLATTDITRLKDEVAIVASSFFRHPDSKTVNPQFWVFADPYFWQRPEQYFIPALQSAVDKGVCTRLFAPSGGLSYFASTHLGPLVDFHSYHYGDRWDINSPIDFSHAIPPFGQNTMTVCLMLAIHLGCNPIYFIGCDRDYWNMTKEEYKTYAVRHFYHEEKPQSTCNEYMPWEEWLKARTRTDWEYEQLKQYAALWGFSIYNATPGGLFESYPRVDYQSLFAPGTVSMEINRDQRELLPVIRTALRLTNEGDTISARILIDESMRRNLNRQDRVAGLQYLKAICLAREKRYAEALIFARQDNHCNPANRSNSQELIRQLESVCGA